MIEKRNLWSSKLGVEMVSEHEGSGRSSSVFGAHAQALAGYTASNLDNMLE